ncbi:hypothetical protein PUV54_06620 [Hyphococcus flavus]|uniref:Uncharacterized protein n=1 Tax=Hyphococcus flavus TaxID=1866326 RepID=A0AAE9ZDN2_9PROT|nr:hypothetical protein [Hyphococcus flavus]WDI32869.1 hypothetical protein PUV54_06620 [Hyphococcus flavus]
MSEEAAGKAGKGEDQTPQPASPLEERMTRAERIFVRINIVQTILAVAGVFTGAVALYAALNESAAVRRQTESAVWPHIRVSDMNFGVPGEERFQLAVSNRGIGPARIKSVKVTVDGEVQTNWYDIVGMVAEEEQFGISNIPIVGMVLSPDEDITAVSVGVPFASKETTEAFRDLVRSGRANMQICYCSVFDECWNLDALTNVTAPVAACPEQNPESRI